MAEPFEIRCPCCDARLSVDPETGAILHHEQPKITEKMSLEEAFKSEEARRQGAGDRFQKAIEQNRQQKEILEKKLREAQKRAERDPGKPRSPFDLD
jgi:hypothetical protein